MSKQKKWAVAAALLVVIVLGIWFTRYSIGLYQQKKETEAALKNGSAYAASTTLAANTIEYQGKTYERNPSIKAVLLMGVDSFGELEQKVTATAGQADAIMIAAYNAASKTVKILMIPRDTMTPITLTDLSGNILGKDIQHLNLAYAYGDGKELSCERMSEAVSELLNGLSMDGYISMNTSMIAELNDLAGGVTVTVEVDGMEKRDPQLTKGSTVTLMGKQAETFVRFRDITIDNSAITRMSQQKQYMEAYLRAVRQQTAKDDQTIIKIMDTIESHMITDMNKAQYMEIGTAVLGSSQELSNEDFLVIPGEAVKGQFFDEFHHDPEGTKKMVLDLFYREK